jgi:GntR family transcriptional regulator/MocR family aminotransferase
MSQRADRAALLPILVDRDDARPMHRQIYDEIRGLILSGRLGPGARLPSTRALAVELEVSRNTVAAAFDQLMAEGYIEGRIGAGTHVAPDLPEEAMTGAMPAGTASATSGPQGPAGDLSRRGTMLASVGFARRRGSPAFTPGLPDMTEFPFDIWARLMARSWRRPPASLLMHGDPAGYAPLRRAIAGYLATARGVRCDADQVIVVAGAQQAIGLAAHVLADEGDEAVVEDPGYPGVRGALLAAGLRLVHAPVDGEGLMVAEAARRATRPRLICVAPSHQYPLGVTLSLARRLQLLDWASREEAWIVEDDYDSEYRYLGRPLAALQGMDRAGRVVYVGSFSKVLFPSLRVGYLVAPAHLIDAFLKARRALDDHPSSVAQPALTAFIEEGHFAAHIRRMRKLYAGRQAALVEQAGQILPDLLTLEAAPAGMHLVARLLPGLTRRLSDIDAAAAIAAQGITASPLSATYVREAPMQGLLLGYAATPADEMADKLARMAAALRMATQDAGLVSQGGMAAARAG